MTASTRTIAQKKPGFFDRLIERVFRQKLDSALQKPITLTLPSGYAFVLGPLENARSVQWTLSSWNGLWRVLLSGPLGMGEGYINADWSSDDLSELLTRLADAMNTGTVETKRWSPSQLIAHVKHATNANSRSGSRRNIEFHYDLGNDFYQRWLDRSMTYSSAEFETPDQFLYDAQQVKYRNACEALALKPGDRVLEIGCGWGGFAEFAARHYGCHVTGITLSHQQLAYAQKRITEANLNERVELRLQDYRDLEGQFDAIVSIEMLEAVGEEHWASYFQQVEKCLKVGGKASIQVITINARDFGGYRSQPDFIQKYIFPGGMLPTNHIVEEAGRAVGLVHVGTTLFGSSYGKTLALWARSFNAAWPSIQLLGFDARFHRVWNFYLAYCEAGFETDRIDVGRFVFHKNR